MSYILQQQLAAYARVQEERLQKQEKRQSDPSKSLFIRKIQNQHAKDKDARIIIVGEGGSGKSSYVLRCGEILNPVMYVENIEKTVNEAISFTAKDYMTGIRTLPSQTVLDFDEPGQGWYHRQFMSEASMILSKTMIGFRYKHFTSMLCVPNIDLLDVDALRLVNWMVYILDQGKAEVYRVVVQKFGGHPWFKKIIDKMTFSKPDTKLWHLYEKRKFAVQDLLYERYGKQLDAIEAPQWTNPEILREIQETPDKFKKAGKFHHSMIQRKFGIGLNRSYLIKAMLDADEAEKK